MTHKCLHPSIGVPVQVKVLGVWIDGKLMGHDEDYGKTVAHVWWSAGWGHEREGWYPPNQVRVATVRSDKVGTRTA